MLLSRFNSLQLSDATWRHRTWSTLFQVPVREPTLTIHHRIHWHEGNFTGKCQDICDQSMLQNFICDITVIFLTGLCLKHRPRVYMGLNFWDSLKWRHNGCDSVSNHQPHHCLLNGLFRGRSKKTSKLCVTGLCAGNSPEAGELPAQMASNAKNVSTGPLMISNSVSLIQHLLGAGRVCIYGSEFSHQ